MTILLRLWEANYWEERIEKSVETIDGETPQALLVRVRFEGEEEGLQIFKSAHYCLNGASVDSLKPIEKSGQLDVSFTSSMDG